MCTHFPLHYFFPFRALWRTKKIVLYFFKNNFRCIFFYKRTFWNYLRSLTLVVIITLDCNLLLWRDFLPNDLEGSRGKLVLWLSLKEAADFQRLRFFKKELCMYIFWFKNWGKIWNYNLPIWKNPTTLSKIIFWESGFSSHIQNQSFGFRFEMFDGFSKFTQKWFVFSRQFFSFIFIQDIY